MPLFSCHFSSMKLPLDFQKFFVKNIQKTKNGLRPLIFKNFLSKIFRKPKMGCAEYATPLIRLLSQPPSPRGEGYIKGSN